MALHLAIENHTSLPDGGPLSISVSGKRGIDIGRDQHLDWTLPDPSRYVSGKHCEIRYRDGGYWLYDVSTNGTFLNNEEGRLKQPYRLRHGDRLTIGHYIVAVTIDGEEEAPAAHGQPTRSRAPQELWMDTGDAAPPIDRRDLRPPEANRPIGPDFLDWAADVPDTFGGVPSTGSARADQSTDDDMNWARASPRPSPAPEPSPPVPTPRRPVWVSSTPSEPWVAPPQASSHPQTSGERDEAGAPSAAAPSAPSEPLGIPPSGEPRADFARSVARGAGISDNLLAGRSPEELAEELGALLRLIVENLQQLLNARQQAKRLTRSSNQTTIQALDNNPLKFSPTAEEALRIMLGPPTRSYLDARSAIAQSFADLKDHQIKTYSAMQHALTRLLSDLDPKVIEQEAQSGSGLGVIGSRKARMWEIYSERWRSKSLGRESGLVDAFMRYFSDCYDGANENTG